jgi:type II secretory pathway pseudopilin PulG
MNYTHLIGIAAAGVVLFVVGWIDTQRQRKARGKHVRA